MIPVLFQYADGSYQLRFCPPEMPVRAMAELAKRNNRLPVRAFLPKKS